MADIIKGYKIKIPKVTGEIKINGVAVKKVAEVKTYKITNNLANCVTNNNATSVSGGSSYAATITVNSGFELMNISITMGGTNVTSSVYKYQNGNAVINIPNVTGDVVIVAQATATSTEPVQPTTYTITRNLTNCTSSNTANSVNQGASYSATVTPSSGYERMNVAITMGGTNVTSTVYKYQDGKAVINIPSVTGNVVITVQATAIIVEPAVMYTITRNLTNCTSNNTTDRINQGESYSATVTPNSGYELMNVAITMGGTNVTSTVYTYQNGKAVINIPNVTGNVVITIQATASSSGGGSGSNPVSGNVLSYMTYGKGINQTSAEITNNPQCWATVEPVTIKNGTTYTMSVDATYLWVLAIDDNGNPIVPFLTTGDNTKPQTFTFTATTSKIKFGCYDPSHAVTHCTLTEGSSGSNPGGGSNPGSGSNPGGSVDPVETVIDGMTCMTYGKGINQTTAVITDNSQCWATVNPVQVVNGKTYTISLDATHVWVYSFDDSDRFVSQLVIGDATNPQTFTFTANSSHIRFGCYDPNHALTYCRVSASGSSSGGSGGTTTYSVTKNLPNCTSSNTASSVNKNANYSTLISANNGYKIDSITVTMGNTDITSSVVTDE